MELMEILQLILWLSQQSASKQQVPTSLSRDIEERLAFWGHTTSQLVYVSSLEHIRVFLTIPHHLS